MKKTNSYYRNAFYHISLKKSGLFINFSVGEHDNGQQFEQLIFIEITLFFIEVFRWKKKKFKSKNLINPSIDDYLLLKILRGEHDNGQKIFFLIYFTGEHDKGDMAKAITVNEI